MSTDDLSSEQRDALIEILRSERLRAALGPQAKLKGISPDAFEDVLERARCVFTLSPNGDLRAKDGLTPQGWMSFVLPTSAPHLFHSAEPRVSGLTAEQTSRRLTARERLDQANGAPGVAGFQ